MTTSGGPLDDETRLRLRIFEQLEERTTELGGFLTRTELSDFDIGGGQRRRLIDMSKGIWNPRDLDATLTIVSSPNGPYADREVEGGYFRYDYRAGSLDGDNKKLRTAYQQGVPLILLRKITGGVYVPIFPVYVVGDDRNSRQFLIALDEALRFLGNPLDPSPLEKRYAQQITKRRLHQPMFRGIVIRAYEVRCAVCRLQHGELLDAAHIIPDVDDQGVPLVTNGLSLCKIHHAAFDRNLMGITPDYLVEINSALLAEKDGPMLKHGLQEMHNTAISLPVRAKDRPNREALANRYEAFLAS